MDISAAIRWVGGLIWAAIVGCFGPPFAVVFAALMVLMVFDTILAVLANGRRHNLNPEAGALGSKRKLSTLIFLLAFSVFYATAEYAGMEFLGKFPTAAIAVALFCAWEILSILVNAKLCGMTLPGPLGQGFDWLTELMAPQKLSPEEEATIVPHG